LGFGYWLFLVLGLWLLVIPGTWALVIGYSVHTIAAEG
jgi:hypothetical protein